MKDLVQRQMYVDPGGGMLNQRILTSLMLMVLTGSNGNDKEMQETTDLILAITLKLTADYQHMERYAKIEDEMIAEARANPITEDRTGPIRLKTAQELYLELDGFLVQLKSTLDHMTNILHFGLGLPFSALTTFGDKGNKVIQILSRNVGGKTATGAPKKQIAQKLIKLIGDNQGWLDHAISVRDRMNHFQHGGVSLQNFTVHVRIEKGEEKVWTPRLHESQTVRELLDVLMNNVVEFVEVFCGFALLPRLTKIAIQYNVRDDINEMRWSLVPIALVRPFERDAKPLE
jgi:hypothetical protein